MGLLARLGLGRDWDGASFDATPAPTFAVDESSIDPAVFGLTSYAAPSAFVPRMDRRAAMQVPAVKRCRDLIAGSIGGLPIDLYSPQRAQVGQGDDTQRDLGLLFTQPEAQVPRSVTMTRTVEDMLFEGISWWQNKAYGWHTYPTQVERVEPRRVTVQTEAASCKVHTDCSGRIAVDGKHVADADMIRFDSPNDPLLVAGARAIRTCLALDAAASRYADGAPPMDYFSPVDQDPEDDDKIVEILDAWRTARQTRSTGYVPAALKYNIAGWNPEQLQLADARQHAVLEIARTAGVDPEELGVSTTSRTYANQFDRRKAFLDFTLGGYMRALEDRLGMGDVTPPGYYARFNLSAFLRSDDLTRYNTYRAGLDVGALIPEEIRPLEDRPAVAAPAQPAPAQEAADA